MESGRRPGRHKIMAMPSTAKRVPSPFSIRDQITERYMAFKKRTHKRYVRFVRQFQVYSTVAFWVVVAYYAGSKGWIF